MAARKRSPLAPAPGVISRPLEQLAHVGRPLGDAALAAAQGHDAAHAAVGVDHRAARVASLHRHRDHDGLALGLPAVFGSSVPVRPSRPRRIAGSVAPRAGPSRRRAAPKPIVTTGVPESRSPRRAPGPAPRARAIRIRPPGRPRRSPHLPHREGASSAVARRRRPPGSPRWRPRPARTGTAPFVRTQSSAASSSLWAAAALAALVGEGAPWPRGRASATCAATPASLPGTAANAVPHLLEGPRPGIDQDAGAVARGAARPRASSPPRGRRSAAPGGRRGPAGRATGRSGPPPGGRDHGQGRQEGGE